MSKKAFKMSKTYCYIGFEGWVVNILNTVLNNFHRKVEYTICIIFDLSFLPKTKMFTEIVRFLYSFLAIIYSRKELNPVRLKFKSFGTSVRFSS